jgi:PIN domain nuclease of toxin-antitoxin system
VLLWWLADDQHLSGEVRAVLADPDTEVFVSAASVWEAAEKRALGKLRFETAELVATLASGGFQALPINALHALAAAELPRHHEDPFDRMLIAQAADLGLTVVTQDRAFEAYGVAVMWA